MNPIGERVAWFVAGLVVGWLAHWLLTRKPPARPQPEAATPVAVEHPAQWQDAPAPHEPASSRVIDVGAARAAGFNIKHADDLTIIEGIGPRTDDLLRANGIGSFAQLARLDTTDLLDLLESGGPNFRLTDPSTWPDQALLATENRWADLKQMQNEMMDGLPPIEPPAENP